MIAMPAHNFIGEPRSHPQLSIATAYLAITVLPAPVSAHDCVARSHGRGRSAGSMRALATALSTGYHVMNVAHPSRHASIEALAPLAIESGLGACRVPSPTRIHFVTHVLRGTFLRQYWATWSIAELGRTIMHAPPNHGGEVVGHLRDVPGSVCQAGSARRELGSADFELGTIAG